AERALPRVRRERRHPQRRRYRARPRLVQRRGGGVMAPRRRTQAALAASPAPAPAPDPAPIALAAAAPPPAAPVRARRLPPRRVSAEVVRAETRLLDLDRRRRQSLEHHE